MGTIPIPKEIYVKRSHIIDDDDEKFNDLVASFDLTNFEHNNFNKLCESLKVNNDINSKIRQIIIDNIDDKDIVVIYANVMKEIYKSGLSDFKIIFGDGKEIHCIKNILMFIPYFSMIIDDFNIDDCITIDDNYDTFISIMDILHCNYEIRRFVYYKYSTINNDNFLGIFILLDKYLMKDYFYAIIDYGNMITDDNIHIKQIAKKLLDEKQYDSMIMVKHLVLSNSKSNLYNLHHKKMENFIDNLLSIDYGSNVFIFDDWMDIFKAEQQLNSIFLTKRYELLNVAKLGYVQYYQMVKNLYIKNCSNRDYIMLKNHMDKIIESSTKNCNKDITKTAGCYGVDSKSKFTNHNEIHFKKCYPNLEYDICTNIYVMGCKIIDNKFEFTLRYKSMNVNKKNKIMFGYVNNVDKFWYYDIVKLEKQIENGDYIELDQINENSESYTNFWSDDYIDKYIITFNEPISNNFNKFYVVKSDIINVEF